MRMFLQWWLRKVRNTSLLCCSAGGVSVAEAVVGCHWLMCALCWVRACVCPCRQMSSSKHGWGSHYTGYGDNVHVNEAGALGVTSAHASEDSIELMVGGGCRELACCGVCMVQASRQHAGCRQRPSVPVSVRLWQQSTGSRPTSVPCLSRCTASPLPCPAPLAALLQVGRDEDGKLGPGWFDVTDSELYPMEERLRTQVAVEALQVSQRGGGGQEGCVCFEGGALPGRGRGVHKQTWCGVFLSWAIIK